MLPESGPRRAFVRSLGGIGASISLAGCFIPMDASDLRIRNRDARQRTIQVTITLDGDTVVFDESFELRSSEHTTRYSVFEKSGTYALQATLQGGTTTTKPVDIPNPRRDPMYHVTVYEGGRLSIGRVAP